MSTITTIVHFTVPTENTDAFLTSWRRIADFVARQPGALHGTFYRSIDANSPFQFVNVAHWESPGALARALIASAEEAKQQGLDVRADMMRLGVRISQNNYVPETTY